MSEHEREELRRKFREGITLAHQRMIEEKALHNACIVVYDPDTDAVVHIPAKDVREDTDAL